MAKDRSFSKRRRKTRSRHTFSTCTISAALLIAVFIVASQRSSSPAATLGLRKSPFPPEIVSRQRTVKIEADVRGNLGPASVLNQDPPGTDWIKDRWQAASDMHGTAIKGAHWVIMEFASPITTNHIVLDWEAALSTDYRIEVNSKANDEEWTVLFDTNKNTYDSHEYGQSPGVKTKTPLHIIHNITTPTDVSFTRLRIWIQSSAHGGWGVSLWQVDVYGWYE